MNLVPDIGEHNLFVSEAINSINVSLSDAATQLQATRVTLEIGEEIVNSVLNLLDQVSVIFIQANWQLMTAGLHNTINRYRCQFSFQMTVF